MSLDGKGLWRASRKGDVGAVQGHLDADGDPNLKHPSFVDTGLHGAVQGNQPGIVDLLLTARTDVNATNKRGETALHYAAWDDNMAECARKLLDGGADVSIMDAEGSTALQVARSKNQQVVATLIEQQIAAFPPTAEDASKEPQPETSPGSTTDRSSLIPEDVTPASARVEDVADNGTELPALRSTEPSGTPAEPTGRAEVQMEAQPQPEAEDEAKMEAQPQPEAEAEAQVEAQPEPEAEPDTAAEL